MEECEPNDVFVVVFVFIVVVFVVVVEKSESSQALLVLAATEQQGTVAWSAVPSALVVSLRLATLITLIRLH